MIRLAKNSDSEDIARIYNHYITSTIVTFEEDEISPADISERLADNSKANLPWLVDETDGCVNGYAYANKWKGRCAYRYSVEVTVYLAKSSVGQGLGTKLYAALFNELRKRSYHTVIGGISLPNPASIALHEKFGMQKVAHFKEVGYKFNQWIDVGYWQGKLNNLSSK